MNTNEVISYNLSQSPNMEQVKDMLQKAFDRFPSVEGLILHSDQGWQYQHAAYREELWKHKVIQSMFRKGNCYVILPDQRGRLPLRMIRYRAPFRIGQLVIGSLCLRNERAHSLQRVHAVTEFHFSFVPTAFPHNPQSGKLSV